MASPQAEHGHIRVANTLWDSFCRIRIPGEARQALDVIIRQTYGYRKKSDMITLDKFALMTGLKKPGIVRAIKKLVQMNLIYKKDNGQYAFQKDFDRWKPLTKKITAKIVDKKDNGLLTKKIIPYINTTINTQTRVVPPTLEEVKEYVKNQGFTNIDPEAFFHYYESRGWKLKGNVPIKKWTSCVHTWRKNEMRFNPPKVKTWQDMSPQEQEEYNLKRGIKI